MAARTCLRIALLALAALVGACGFQLRGQASLPFETLYLSLPEYSPMSVDLQRYIAAGTNAKIVSEASQAQAILEFISEERKKIILSFDAAGRVREYQLRYTLAFRVHDPRGRDYIPRSELRLARDISYSDVQVLSKESEEQLLYRDMQRDMVQQILRRLAAAPATPIAIEPGAGDATAR